MTHVEYSSTMRIVLRATVGFGVAGQVDRMRSEFMSCVTSFLEGRKLIVYFFLSGEIIL